jgi:nucleotide-binding universal stress UspA family protein
MFKEILFAIDLNAPETQQKALGAALAYAKMSGATLHVMTVVPDFGMTIVASYFPPDFEKRAIEDANTQLHEYVKTHVPKGIKVQHIVGHGTIYSEILREAADIGADLIVMASHRPELKDYLLGPNASHVVKHADCSVLVVRN